MPTWRVLTIVFYVFMKIYSSEGDCFDYLDDVDSFENWKNNISIIPEEYLRFPVKIGSTKDDVIDFLNKFCCQQKETKRNEFMCLLLDCFGAYENCPPPNDRGSDRGLSLSDLACMIAIAQDNKEEILARGCTVPSTASPATTVPHTTTTTTQAAKVTTTTQSSTTTTETSTSGTTTIGTSKHLQNPDGNHNQQRDVPLTTNESILALFLIPSLILNVVLGMYVIRQKIQSCSSRNIHFVGPVPPSDPGDACDSSEDTIPQFQDRNIAVPQEDTKESIQMNSDDQNDTYI